MIDPITKGVAIRTLFFCLLFALSIAYSNARAGFCSQKYTPGPNQSHSLVLAVNWFPFKILNPTSLSQLWKPVIYKGWWLATVIYYYLLVDELWEAGSFLSFIIPASTRNYLADSLVFRASWVTDLIVSICVLIAICVMENILGDGGDQSLIYIYISRCGTFVQMYRNVDFMMISDNWITGNSKSGLLKLLEFRLRTLLLPPSHN